MILKNKIIIITIFLASCQTNVRNLKNCDNLYKDGKLEECVSCTREYLKKYPNDIKTMKLFVDCAQSKEDLDEIQLYIKNKYALLKTNIEFFIVYGDVCMKLKEYSTAYTSYRIGRLIDSTYQNINYKTAFALLNFERSFNNLNKDEMKEVLYLVNQELKFNPNDSASQSLKEQCMDSLVEMKW